MAHTMEDQPERGPYYRGKPKLVGITVNLSNQDSNVFNLIGLTRYAMKQAGVSPREISAFSEEAVAAKDYDSVIQTIMRWVNVE